MLARVGAVRQTLMDQLALVIGVSEGLLLRSEWRLASAAELFLFLLGSALVLLATKTLYAPQEETSRERALEPMVSAMLQDAW